MSFKKILSILCAAAIGASFTACGTVSAPDGGRPNGPDYSDNGGPGDNATGDNSDDNSGDNSGGGDEIPDNNDVQTPTPDATDHNFTFESENGGVITFACPDCKKKETVTVTCDSGTADAYTVSGSTITFAGITEKSVYGIKGALHGNIVIDVGDDYKFELEMSGLELTSDKQCPLSVLSGDKVTLSAKKSTENYIYDLREAAGDKDISSAVYAKCDLDVQGKGSLFVKSAYNNGIHTKNDLNVKNLSLQVDCVDNALKGNDSVTIEAGEVVLISRQGDGIKTTDSDISSKGNQRGDVTVTGGDVLIYAACDGIDAAHDVIVDQSTADVTLQIFTDKYSKYSEEVTAVGDGVYYVRHSSTNYKYSLKFYNDEDDAVWYNSASYKKVNNYYYYSVTKPSGYSYVRLYIYGGDQQQGQGESYVACTEGMAVNGNYDTIALQQRGSSLSYSWTNYSTQNRPAGPGGFGGMGGMNDGNADKGDHSTKGIKAADAVSIAAGNITISAYDDAIHANTDGALENGKQPLGNVTVSGGSLTLRSNDDAIHADGKAVISGGTVNIVSSYEGIEGNTVLISGGSTTVKSSDDGINGTATSGTAITVSGDLYVYAGGDGVDSNSKTQYEGIVFSGGKSVIISTGNADSSIDSENGYKYTGGSVVAIGRSGGMGNEATKCQNFSAVGTSKTLNLSSGAYLVVSGVATVKMPTAINALIVCLGKTSANISSATSTSYTLDANGVFWN